MKPFLLSLALALSSLALGDEAADFRPQVAAALKRGETRIVIPPGTYRLAPVGGDKTVWSLVDLHDVEIEAEGVTLLATKLTRALGLHACRNLKIHGLTIDYDPLPFTQGTVAAVAEDKSWIEVKLHAGYPRQAYSRIDVVDPATRYRKKGMPFLWGTRAEMKGEDTVRVTLKDIGKAASVGDLASLNTGPGDGGIPHAVGMDRCSDIELNAVTVHSAPGMGILEADGEGKTRYIGCRVVPGPRPAGATEERLLSTSWDAMQTKTVRYGPWLEGCEITEAGDDSWSVQSCDFMVLKKSPLIVACRDEYTIGVEKGDHLTSRLGGPLATITAHRELTRDAAQLAPEILAKLKDAPGWSEWKVGNKCLELGIEGEVPFEVGDSVFSPDRMGNGFVFIKNRLHSSGRLLIKASGRIEDNILDTPHALTVCPELPAKGAAGIDGLIIRRNKILRAGWFCPAPWSASAGALSITASGDAQKLRGPGIFQNLVIEDNTFEDCSGPNLVMSSVRGANVKGNRFVRAQHDSPPATGASYGIASNSVIWTAQCEDVTLESNEMIEVGEFAKETQVQKP
ncbi:right-handed parallel beta-helix repeat-containing protein [Haloferula sp. BvORR071]|uniref:right-handed parallel beta-helix repeat-containing protein n=1 Tax=Haloferula sp. BvORR071 TaxID=1396141 RepID=UPI00054DB086|nr:right-handed parallel beta-helix repeat-containing protein [Haloferula sp. BvORR071]